MISSKDIPGYELLTNNHDAIMDLMNLLVRKFGQSFASDVKILDDGTKLYPENMAKVIKDFCDHLKNDLIWEDITT